MNFISSILSLLFLSAGFSSISQDIQQFLSFALQPIPEVRMLAFGDLMLDRDVKRFMNEKGEDYPFEKIFGPEGIDTSEYDIVNANLEGPIYDSPSRADLFPQFAFDPDVAPQLLKKWGFTLLNLANNHTWDKALKGWETTLQSLHDVGINTVGHPKNNFETDLYETEIKGIKMGFIGITDVLRPFPVDWEEAKKKIQELKSRNQFVVLFIHWGKEFQTKSSQRQQDKAHGLIDAGVDLIIGHHPHVVQESEIYNGKMIYYSLGNFVFDQYFSKEVQQGLGLDIRLSLDGKIEAKEIPFVIEKGQPRLDSSLESHPS
jgi:poly-gamma-glutamate synthesis protein (capsule biosynthesis protein)